MSSSESKKDEITIPAVSEFVRVARLAISGIAMHMDFTVEDIEDIKIAVSEACTNAVLYAYNGTKEGYIKLTCEVSGDTLDIQIEDQGVGFDMEKVKESESDNDEKGLGLGLMFVKNLMDEVTITSELGKGTRIKMAKKISHKLS